MTKLSYNTKTSNVSFNKKIVKDKKPTNGNKGRFFNGTTGFFNGKKHSEESKKKMRDARKKYFENNKNRENMSIKMTGKKQTKETIEKKSTLLKNKWINDKEWREKRMKQIQQQNKNPKIRIKLSQALKGKQKSKQHIEKVSKTIKEW